MIHIDSVGMTKKSREQSDFNLTMLPQKSHRKHLPPHSYHY